MKPISFLGSSLDDLRGFAEVPRREIGHQLERVQIGLLPADWKPMPSIGAGVRELRVRDDSGITYRAIYLASRPEAIYVLHAFQKKTQATAKRDIDVATRRFRDLQRG